MKKLLLAILVSVVALPLFAQGRSGLQVGLNLGTNMRFGKDVSYMFANASNLKRDLAGCDEMICKHDTAVGMLYNTPIVRSNYKSYEFLDLDKEEAFASSKYDCWILNRIYYYDGMLAYTSYRA